LIDEGTWSSYGLDSGRVRAEQLLVFILCGVAWGCSNIGNRGVVRCWNCLPSVIEEIRISMLVSTVLGHPDQMFESM
jgi:hypothetical protein